MLLIAGLCLALGCGIVGFTDDYTKIKLKRNEGLSPKQKTLGQLIMTFGYTLTLWLSHNTVWYIPFIGNVDFEKIFSPPLYSGSFRFSLFTVASIRLTLPTVSTDFARQLPQLSQSHLS